MKSISLILFLLLAIVNVSAWPYQLNVSNGILYDTNVSNNTITNFTIYVVYTNITNITYINQTNITYINQTNFTCFNCTNINNTYYNYTYYYNSSNWTNVYNITESDARYVSLANFNSYKSALVYPYPSQADFNALVTKVNAMNITSNTNNSISTERWIIFALIIVMAILVAVIIVNSRNSGGYGG